MVIGYTGVCFGGSCRKYGGCFEFSGPVVRRVLKQMPTGSGAAAMTLGHTILGQTQADLDATRRHEHVHVRQYEKWGPVFIPAYFTASLVAWLKGRDPYMGNFFEIEAYGLADDSPGEIDVSEHDHDLDMTMNRES